MRRALIAHIGSVRADSATKYGLPRDYSNHLVILIAIERWW